MPASDPPAVRAAASPKGRPEGESRSAAREATPSAAGRPRRLPGRAFVLAAAFVLALAVAQGPRMPNAHAQDAKPAPPAPAAPAAPPAPAQPPAAKKGPSASVEVRTDDQGRKTVTIKADEGTPDEEIAKAKDAASVVLGVGPGRHGKSVSVRGVGDDADYDSFDQLVEKSPWIAFMVFMVVAVVFLAPVLAIALILWYRMRKARMLNETMVRLAEKGVVPPAEAIGALAGGTPAAASPSVAPLYEQAKQLRRRAAWSDLRKGVIIGGVGLGLTLYAALDDRSPNALGLVLLFVGIGYLALWWFEERRAARGDGSGAPPAIPGGTGGGT